MTTEAQQTELERPGARVVYFVEFDFLDGKQRLCTWNKTLPWNGYDWLGLGAISAIGQVDESESLDARALSFTLNAAEPTWLALAAGPVEEYRGRSAKMYMCPLNENYQLVDTPEQCWRGIMDAASIGIDGEEGSIVLKCETSAFGLKRRQTLRMNATQQKKKYPTDTGFDYLVDLIARPQLWVSKRFQTV